MTKCFCEMWLTFYSCYGIFFIIINVFIYFFWSWGAALRINCFNETDYKYYFARIIFFPPYDITCEVGAPVGCWWGRDLFLHVRPMDLITVNDSSNGQYAANVTSIPSKSIIYLRKENYPENYTSNFFFHAADRFTMM